jgi:aspartate racemase
MAQHIGIVACSAEGAALCYRTICAEGAALMGRHSHPEITMHTYPLNDYMERIIAGDWEAVAFLMLNSAKKVAGAGADFIICPDNTIHQAFDLFGDLSLLPWMHIADVVIEEAISWGFRKPLILGTRYLMEGPVYTSRLEKLGLEYAIPDEKDRERINRIIFDELVLGRIVADARQYLSRTIDSFRQEECDSVILGCTELPMIITPDNSPLPPLDSTRLLAVKALKAAVGCS